MGRAYRALLWLPSLIQASLIVLFSVSVFAETKEAVMKEGMMATNFTLPDATGNQVSLADFKGKTVILVFYPGDFTPVCTKQLCDYRDKLILPKEKYQVIGINANSAESHKKFQEEYHLPYPLLSDSDKKVCKQFGMTTFGMVSRGVILIDPEGKIRKIEKVLPIFRPSAERIREMLREAGLDSA